MIWIVWVLLYAHINSVGSDCYFHQRACQCSVEAWHQKLEVLVPSVVQIMKEDSSARVTSLFLTPHVVVIRSAYSCFSSKQINIYYSHSSVQLGGTLDSAQTAQRCHIKELCERRFYFQWPLSSQLCLYETEEGHRGILGDTAPDINKQYSLCLAGGVVS